LRLTGNLESLLPDLPQSPVALLKSKGRQRARVRRPQKVTGKDGGPWKWGE
jgi:hypothetical protein